MTGRGTSSFDPRRPTGGIRRYAWNGRDIREDIRSKYGFDGDLIDIYVEGAPQGVHKWHHYLPLYDRYFGPWRNRPLRFLEIGVSKGGSLSMWRRYFGAEAVIYGIDLDPDCARYNALHGQVRIGSQDDPAFLGRVVDEMGGLDVVLDDGSHIMSHIRTALDALFPRLSPDGIYMIEDLHTAYWPDFEGGLDMPGNLFGFLRTLADDMHHWYHAGGQRHPHIAGQLRGIHMHDSICVLEKGDVPAPTHSKVQRR
ncbi:MAG: class I SAM-dependent methyltransferase [Pseudomonadota bacterium]